MNICVVMKKLQSIMKFQHQLLFLFLSFLISHSFAQELSSDSTQTSTDSTKSRYVSFYNEKDDPFKQFDAKPEPKEFKKKKPKRKVYYGHKTRKGYTKYGYGRNETREIFHYLKYYQDPSIYAYEVYWFHTKKLKVMKTKASKVDKDFARILHGPYKKIVGGEIIEQGIYYIGTKHGRWEKYKKPKDYTYKDTVEIEQKILIKKEKYYKGYPKEADISFYDEGKTKIKEVKPLVNGELHGDYFYFYENGLPKIIGKYIHNQKVGNWTEYFETETKSIKHLQTKHPRNPYVEQFEPYISKEWDRHRHLIYDHDKDGDREEEEESTENEEEEE